MTKEELEGLMSQYKRTGNLQVPQNDQPTAQTQTASSALPPSASNSSSPNSAESTCPVDHKNMSKEQVSAFMSKRGQANNAGGKSSVEAQTVYDVYGQELDRANMMPATPNQLPSPGQTKPLSTQRVKSTIPKAGDDHSTWTYPSEQMFYNALKRKGKADGVREADMEAVIKVHNSMNEKTWREVMEWEQKYHCHKCDNPRLKRFLGRPHDVSPAARFRTWFRGYPMPFDRHDWVLDRCGEEEVRYVIDYYYRDGPDPIEIHVRPAMDSVSAVMDRVRNRFALFKDYALDAAPASIPASHDLAMHEVLKKQSEHVVDGEQLDEKEFAFLSGLTPSGIEEISKDVQERCANVSKAFEEAGDDPVKMEQANMSINYCMAQRLCKTQASNFMNALEIGSNEAAAYEKMTSCLDRFHIMARRALLEAAGVVQSGPEFPAGVASSIDTSRSHAPASRVEEGS